MILKKSKLLNPEKRYSGIFFAYLEDNNSIIWRESNILKNCLKILEEQSNLFDKHPNHLNFTNLIQDSELEFILQKIKPSKAILLIGT